MGDARSTRSGSEEDHQAGFQGILREDSPANPLAIAPASYPRKGMYSEGSKDEEPNKGGQSQSQHAGVLEEELSEMTMRNYRNVMMPALMAAGRTDMPPCKQKEPQDILNGCI